MPVVVTTPPLNPDDQYTRAAKDRRMYNVSSSRPDLCVIGVRWTATGLGWQGYIGNELYLHILHVSSGVYSFQTVNITAGEYDNRYTPLSQINPIQYISGQVSILTATTDQWDAIIDVSGGVYTVNTYKNNVQSDLEFGMEFQLTLTFLKNAPATLAGGIV